MPRPPVPEIDASEFIHVITFLDPVTGSDISGSTVSYAPASPPETAWAKIDSPNATDVIKSGQDVSQVFLMITMNYRSGSFNNRHLLTPGGSELIVRAVQNVREMNMFLVLTCIGIGGNN
jgi:head-tail adaptor